MLSFSWETQIRGNKCALHSQALNLASLLKHGKLPHKTWTFWNFGKYDYPFYPCFLFPAPQPNELDFNVAQPLLCSATLVYFVLWATLLYFVVFSHFVLICCVCFNVSFVVFGHFVILCWATLRWAGRWQRQLVAASKRAACFVNLYSSSPKLCCNSPSSHWNKCMRDAADRISEGFRLRCGVMQALKPPGACSLLSKVWSCKLATARPLGPHSGCADDTLNPLPPSPPLTLLTGQIQHLLFLCKIVKIVSEITFSKTWHIFLAQTNQINQMFNAHETRRGSN